MHPLVKGAMAAAALGALGARGPREPAPVVPPDAQGVPAPLESAGCPERALSLGGPCVRLPDDPGAPRSARARRLGLLPPEEPPAQSPAGASLVPRLPERPVAFADYQLPVDPVINVGAPRASEPGIRIESEPGAPVHLVDLEGQTGRASVALVGQLHGVTVIVRHRVEGAAGKRDYLVVYGRLDRPGPHVVNGAELGPLAVIGYVADGEDESPHVYLEVREQLHELGRPAEHLTQLVSPGISVPVDPRNMLPLKK